MRTKWLPRDVINLPFSWCVCTTEEAFKKILKEYKLPKDEWPDWVVPNKEAAVHWLEHSSGQQIAVVCIKPPREEVDSIKIASLLVHEAVHLWQELETWMSDTKTSQEFEAYAIQKIVQTLFYQYKEQVVK